MNHYLCAICVGLTLNLNCIDFNPEESFHIAPLDSTEHTSLAHTAQDQDGKTGFNRLDLSQPDGISRNNFPEIFRIFCLRFFKIHLNLSL